jgi:hypothetical protein
MRTTSKETDLALDRCEQGGSTGGNNGVMTSKEKSWRDVLRIHPACDALPLMGKDELCQLADDIEKHGLHQKIDLYRDADGTEHVLDGRNRLDAIELLGETPIGEDGRLDRGLCGVEFDSRDSTPEDLTGWVISCNIRRRHLTPVQKREMLANLLRLDPSKSNRVVAKAAGVSPTTVGEVRAELEATVQIGQLEKTTGADGKERPAKKPKLPPAEVNAEIIPHPGIKVNCAAQPTQAKPEEEVKPADEDLPLLVEMPTCLKRYPRIKAIAGTVGLLAGQLQSIMREMRPAHRAVLVLAVCAVVKKEGELAEAEDKERRKERRKQRL